MAGVASVQAEPTSRLTPQLSMSGLLRTCNQADEVAERVNHIVRLTRLEFFQGTKAIRDGTGLEASGFPRQDVRGGIAHHQSLLWGTVERRQRCNDAIWSRL